MSPVSDTGFFVYICTELLNMKYVFSFNSFRHLKALGIFLLLMGSAHVHSQYYSIGQDPATLKWSQIRTGHFRVIFPSGSYTKGQYVANLLETVYDSATYILGHKPAGIPVILHNREVTPNALTIWAPKRIEIFTCPPQNIYSQDWLEQLVLHEYAHVIQFDKSNRGTTRVLSWLLGETAPSMISGIFIPTWFFEGDAVFTETVLSKSGRGRMPDFSMELRAQLLGLKYYSYEKAVFGSYRNFVPDHYVLGYHLVTNTRRRYGMSAWNKSLENVADYPFLITPFNRGLKITTGMRKVALYRQTLRDIDSLWSRQDKLIVKTAYTNFSAHSNKYYTRYKYPHYINDSVVLALRMSLDDIPRFVLLARSGKEKIVCTPGFFSSEPFSFNGSTIQNVGANKPGTIVDDDISLNSGILAWAEKEADPRWQNRSYSVIKTFNFETGKLTKLTKQSRYFSPAVSPDGKHLLVVEITEENIYSLLLLDIATGKPKETVYSSALEVLLTPSWSPDGQKIVFVVLSQKGKSLKEFNVQSGELTTLLDAGFTEINCPVYSRDFIFLNAAYSGIENIYAIKPQTKEVFQVTSASFGACNAQSLSGGRKIIYSDYNTDGYRLVETDFNPSGWKRLSQVEDYSVKLFETLLKPGQFTIDSASSYRNSYPVEKYNKLAHLFRFHSWAPLYLNAFTSEIKPGVSIMSQNDLSTATMIAGYEWDYGEKTGRGRISFSWEGWYPVFDFEGTYGSRTQYETLHDTVSHAFTWNETRWATGVKLPLFFNHGKSYSGLTLLARSVFIGVSNNTSLDEEKLSGTINSMDYRLVYFRYCKQSFRDLYPQWGFYTDINFRHSPWGQNQLGSIASAGGTLFIPGIVKHHGFRVYVAFQQRNKGDYSYADLISLPRGYYYLSSENVFSIKLTYKMPIAYPDFNIGSLAYIKRIKSAFFYDYAHIANTGRNRQIDSFGAELTGDMHLLRFIFPLDPGIRIGYKPGEKAWFAEPMFSVNLAF